MRKWTTRLKDSCATGYRIFEDPWQPVLSWECNGEPKGKELRWEKRFSWIGFWSTHVRHKALYQNRTPPFSWPVTINLIITKERN
jgi:hypothetical protein